MYANFSDHLPKIFEEHTTNIYHTQFPSIFKMREVWGRIVKEHMNVGMYNYPFYARSSTNTPRSYASDHRLSIENDGTCLVPHMDHTNIWGWIKSSLITCGQPYLTCERNSSVA